MVVAEVADAAAGIASPVVEALVRVMLAGSCCVGCRGAEEDRSLLEEESGIAAGAELSAVVFSAKGVGDAGSPETARGLLVAIVLVLLVLLLTLVAVRWLWAAAAWFAREGEGAEVTRVKRLRPLEGSAVLAMGEAARGDRGAAGWSSLMDRVRPSPPLLVEVVLLLLLPVSRDSRWLGL